MPDEASAPAAPTQTETAAPPSSPIPNQIEAPPVKPSTRPTFDDLVDELPDENGKKPEPKPKVQEQQQPEEEVEQPEEPKEEKQKQDPSEGEQFKNKPAWQLRKRLDEMKAELKARDEEIAKYKSKPTDEADRVKLSETLKEREERLKAAEEKIKYYDYTASQEFVDKYKKPYDEAAASATQKATEISIKNADGTSQKVSRDDFWNKIVMAQDEDAAMENAYAMFGEDRLAQSKVSRILTARDEVLTRYRAMENGKADFQKNVEARQRDLDAQRAQQNIVAQKRIEEFNSLNTEAEKKYPHWFAPKEGDEEINKALEAGKRLADSVFGEGRNKVPPEQLVKNLSAARMQIIGFNRVVAENARLSKKLAEAQKQIEGYKGSSPGNGAQKGIQKPRTSGHSLQSAFDAIDALPDNR